MATIVAISSCDSGDGGGGGGTEGDADTGEPIGPAEEDEYAEAIAAAICTPQFSCGCTDLNYANQDACIAERKAILDTRAAAAEAEGLTYDESCSAIQLNYYAELACAPNSEETTCVVCNAYHGDLEEGAACQNGESGYPTCKQGLNCEDGFCVNPCPEIDYVPKDGTCDFESKLCDPAADLYCDGATLTCTEAPKFGEPCPLYFCGQGLWCNADDPGGPICLDLRLVGEMCVMDAMCVSRACDVVHEECIAATPLVCSL